MNVVRDFNAERLENLIAEDKLPQVLGELMVHAKVKDKEMYNELLVHVNNINAIRKERGMGLISFFEQQQVQNRIILRLTQLISDLDKVYNKKRFILEFRGEVEGFNEDMRLQVTKNISNLFENQREAFEIVGVYAGSIKVVIETKILDIYKLVSSFENNSIKTKALFKDIELLNIINEDTLFEKIALCFYSILLKESLEIVSIKEVFETLNKHKLLRKSTISYFLEAGFQGTNLTMTHLPFANLRGADLHGADLNGADLHSADLTMADLSLANLPFANLKDSDLRFANLRGADLNWADLKNVNLIGADLTFANLRGANLNGIKWGSAKSKGMRLTVTSLIAAELSRTDLSRADLSGVNLSEADLSEANLTKVNLKEADLSWANLNWADLCKADLSEADLTKANVRFTILFETNLTNVSLRSADLTGADLRGANLTGADLTETDLTGAKLTNYEQLLTTASLYQVKGLLYSIKAKILGKRPELFDDPNGGKTEKVLDTVEV